jgi:hypothetical protein
MGFGPREAKLSQVGSGYRQTVESAVGGGEGYEADSPAVMLTPGQADAQNWLRAISLALP